jgi:hypothetical protein
VDHATTAFGMAVPSGIVASTGVAGLTLGGGETLVKGAQNGVAGTVRCS